MKNIYSDSARASKLVFYGCALLFSFAFFYTPPIMAGGGGKGGGGTGSSVDTLRINLAVPLTASLLLESNKEYFILIENKLLQEGYTVGVQRKSTPIPELSLPSTTSAPDAGDPAGKALPLGGGPCQNIAQAVDDLYKSADEAELITNVATLRFIIAAEEQKLGDGTTTTCTTQHLQTAKLAVKLTRQAVGKYKLRAGEELEVVIKREVDDQTFTWKTTYTTPPRGTWQVSYGFSLITQMLDREDIYYCAPIGSTSNYYIRKEENRRQVSFAPSIIFTWMPYKALTRSLSVGASGGLGFDFENPTLFAGPTLSFNQNIRFNFGIAAHKQLVLLGKYNDDASRITSENLTREQLHESLYRFNPFISLSLRFNQNPFERRTQP